MLQFIFPKEFAMMSKFFFSLLDMAGQIKFFKKAHFFWIAAITGGMTLLAFCHYSPDSVPHKDLRPADYILYP